jgi:hypothetical protein
MIQALTIILLPALLIVNSCSDNQAILPPLHHENEVEVCVPELIAPADGAVMDNGCWTGGDGIVWDFDWTDCEGAEKYQITLFRAGGQVVSWIDSTLTSSSYHVVSSGAYYAGQNRFNQGWRVRAKVDGKWGPWSVQRSFDVEPHDADC